MSVVAFTRHLAASKEAIMERWQAAVLSDAADLPSAQDLSRPQLWDHLPHLLDEIAAVVAGEPAPAVETGGRAHGRMRWSDGYDIVEVVRELCILRETLLDVVDEYSRANPGLGGQEAETVRRRLHHVIDRSAQAGAAQYHDEAISVRRQLWMELESAYLELKAADEQKDRFLAMLAHELRNPLGPILTAVQLLEAAEPAEPRLRQAREVVERQVRRQVRLIDDLLDVSRIARGKIALRREAHDLKSVAAYVGEVCLPAIKEKGQQLHVELPDQPLRVDADPVRLEQVITNLLANANRYTDSGGQIWLSAAREGEVAVVRVRDNGIGMSPEMLPRVFDLFTQGDTSSSRSEGGLGIGLAIVKNLVALHGGTVEALSQGMGTGSEFVVRLPLASGETSVLTLPRERREPSVAARRVALVEDNPDARSTLAELLEVLGYPVLTAANGPEALRLAATELPEAFVIDIGLPGMDGYQLARALRQLPGGDRTLLIALTGYGSPDEKQQAQEAGFDAHLTKPADIDELERLLSQPS